jgi:hypothetical protein
MYILSDLGTKGMGTKVSDVGLTGTNVISYSVGWRPAGSPAYDANGDLISYYPFQNISIPYPLTASVTFEMSAPWGGLTPYAGTTCTLVAHTPSTNTGTKRVSFMAYGTLVTFYLAGSSTRSTVTYVQYQYRSTITMPGLEPGRSYQITLFWADDRNCFITMQ